MATFGEPSTRFKRGGPGGPGRRRKYPWRDRSAPWLDLQRPGFDPDDAFRQWILMVRAGHLGALRRLVEYLADWPAADDATELEDVALVDAIVRVLRSVHSSRAGSDTADQV